MASSFSACGRCGVRLSGPSMAYHQQLCGKQQQQQQQRAAEPPLPLSTAPDMQPSFGAPPTSPLFNGNPHNSVPPNHSGGMPFAHSPTAGGGQQRRMDPNELNALRNEVYGGGPPAAVRRHQPNNSGGFHDQHHRDAFLSDGQEATMQRAHPGRGGSSQAVAHHHNNSSSIDTPPPAVRSGSGKQEHVLLVRLEGLDAAFEEHVEYCRREFVHLENAMNRQKATPRNHGGVEGLQPLREDLQQVSDEVVMLRRDFKVLGDENARLRDEVRKLKSERSASIAGDEDFIELKGEVARLKGQLETTARESHQHLREMVGLRDECFEENAAVKKDGRHLNRELESLREEMDTLRRRVTSMLSTQQQQQQQLQDGGGRSGTPTTLNGAKPNISLTVQHHAPPSATGSSSSTALPRRSVSGGGAAQQSAALQRRNAERSGSNSGYVSVDEPDEAPVHTTRRSQQSAASSRSQRGSPPRTTSRQLADDLDNSVLQMRRDTESIISKAMQHRRPATVVSARSISRGTDDDRHPSASPEQRGNIPVAHATLR